MQLIFTIILSIKQLSLETGMQGGMYRDFWTLQLSHEKSNGGPRSRRILQIKGNVVAKWVVPEKIHVPHGTKKIKNPPFTHIRLTSQ